MHSSYMRNQIQTVFQWDEDIQRGKVQQSGSNILLNIQHARNIISNNVIQDNRTKTARFRLSAGVKQLYPISDYLKIIINLHERDNRLTSKTNNS